MSKAATDFRSGHGWRFPAGHHKPGADTNHFLGAQCNECNAHYLVRMSLEQVENWYRVGHVGQALFEAYMHVWATGAARFGNYLPWKVPPGDPEVVELVRMLREAAAGRAS